MTLSIVLKLSKSPPETLTVFSVLVGLSWSCLSLPTLTCLRSIREPVRI